MNFRAKNSPELLLQILMFDFLRESQCASGQMIFKKILVSFPNFFFLVDFSFKRSNLNLNEAPFVFLEAKLATI